jgi:3-dehydroquinate dehydratase-1
MICASLAEASLAECLTALEGLALAEMRLDRMEGLSLEDVATLFSYHKRLIATCRPGGFSDDARKARLLAAVAAGAAYVDIELESKDGYREEIITKAREFGCEIIVSFHDYEKTPDRKTLSAIVEGSFLKGADIVKIACTVRSERDNARLLGLLDDLRKIVVIGMGEKGRITRVAAPFLGSPFTFASLAEGRQTAEGQIDKATLESLAETLRQHVWMEPAS